MIEYIFRRSEASIAIITDLRAMQYHEATIEFSGTVAQIKEPIRGSCHRQLKRYDNLDPLLLLDTFLF